MTNCQTSINAESQTETKYINTCNCMNIQHEHISSRRIFYIRPSSRLCECYNAQNRIQINNYTDKSEPFSCSTNLTGMPLHKNFIQIKTNLTVIFCLLVAILFVISLAGRGLEIKTVIASFKQICIKVVFLTIPHFWILRSEDIFQYVKRKIVTKYNLLKAKLFYN